MSRICDVDPERNGLDPLYDYDAVEQIALARAGPVGLSRAQLLRRAAVGVLAITCAPATALARSTASRGTIDFYSWQGYDIPGVAKPWLKQNNISFHARYFGANGSDEILIALRAGQGKSQYNLATYYGGDGLRNRDLKVAPQIDVSKVPNVKGFYPFLRVKNVLSRYWKAGNTWWGIPFTFGGNTGLYDSAKITTPPTSWLELLKPAWKDRFVIVDDLLATFNMGAHIVGGFNVNSLYRESEVTKIFDLLTKFKANARTVASYGQVPDLFASGETEAATASWAAIANQAAAKGKKTIRPFLPREGANSFVDVWFTPPSNHPQDLPVVLEFINFSISAKAQAYAAKSLSGGVLTPAGEPLLDPATKALYPYNDLAGFFRKAPVVANFPAESDQYVTQKYMTDAWNAFKAA